MDNSTPLTTENKAREAIKKFITTAYSEFGFRTEIADRIVSSLTDVTQRNQNFNEEPNEPSLSVEYVRNTLRSFSGGSATSDVITSRLFIELGRGDELGYLWQTEYGNELGYLQQTEY